MTQYSSVPSINNLIYRLRNYLKSYNVVRLSSLMMMCSMGLFSVCFTSDAAEPSYVSPYYFGPNAFPIPEIVDSTSSTLNIEVSSNYFNGRRGDKTWDVTLKAIIPLWSDRVNLCIWLPAMEWYRHSTQYLESCNILPPYPDNAERGSLTGDVYVTTNMLILRESGKLCPDILLRAGLKTASGGGSTIARYYDCPGYFFDAAISKTLSLSKSNDIRLRFSLASGFLCWQTDKDKQNDAVMFGVKVKLDWKKFAISECFSGYSGWEHLATNPSHLAHDFPMSFKTQASYSFNNKWSVFGIYEHGLSDYPYNHFGIGAIYKIDILKKKDKAELPHK